MPRLFPDPQPAAKMNHGGALKEYIALKHELEDSEAPHPWAGDYGDFYIGRSGRFCIHGPGNIECGRLGQAGDRLVRVDAAGGIPLPSGETAPDLRIVRWGDRTYLLDAAEMLPFVNAINAGGEPRFQDSRAFGRGRLRRGDDLKPAPGLPVLPAALASFILPQPVVARVIAAEARREVPFGRHPWPTWFETRASVDAGQRQGLKAGMVFFPQDHSQHLTARVVRVFPGRAEVVLNEFGADKPPLSLGWLLSTRYRYTEKRPYSATPFTIAVRPASARRYPALQGTFLQSIRSTAAFHGGMETGFDWTHVGDVTLEAGFPGALERKDARPALEGAIRSLGANVFEQEYWWSTHDRGRFGAGTEVAHAYLLTFEGRTIKPDDVGILNLDDEDEPRRWTSARAWMVLRANRFYRRHAELDAQVWCEQLRLRPEQCPRYPRLRIEDLGADQRSWLKDGLGIPQTRGRLAQAVWDSDKWSGLSDQQIHEAWRRLHMEMKKDRAAAKEYFALYRIIDKAREDWEASIAVKRPPPAEAR